jgi:hypothetical protein
MFRTTKALTRLGVPVLAAVTLVGGVPAFLGPAHAATPRTQVSSTSGFTVDLTALDDATPATNTRTSPEDAINDTRDTDRRFRAVVNTGTSSATSTVGTGITFSVSGGSGDETATQEAGFEGDPDANDRVDAMTNCTTNEYTTSPDSASDSACDVQINDPTPDVRQVLSVTATIRATGVADAGTLRYRVDPARARFVVVIPKSGETPAGGAATFTATVTDAQSRPVFGVPVTFSETGAGRITTGATATVTTSIAGTATVTTTSASGEGGQQTVTGTISAATTDCDEPASGSTLAGQCTDIGITTFVVPPATSTATVTVSINTPVIVAGSRGSLTLNGPPNADVVLEAYSRPNTIYRVVRTGTLSALGTLTFDNLVPSGNTRLRARVAGGQFNQSAVILVRSKLSLRTERLGTRTYRFTGRVLPARAGQLVFVYRGNVLATVARVQANGIYAVNRRFLGTGTFTFTARTGTDITNVGGVSPGLRVAIR